MRVDNTIFIINEPFARAIRNFSHERIRWSESRLCVSLLALGSTLGVCVYAVCGGWFSCRKLLRGVRKEKREREREDGWRSVFGGVLLSQVQDDKCEVRIDNRG